MNCFSDYIYNWMVDYKMNSVKPSSYDRLERSFNLMKKYPIAKMPLELIGTDTIQRYLNELVEDDYALSTIRKQFHLITEFMDHANVKGIVERPYHRGVKLPSRSVVKKETKAVVAYSFDEQTKLLRTLKTFERPGYSAALLMLETGMRIGEVLALTWDDIDWRRRAINVHKTFVRLGNRRKSYIQNEAKSYSSNRSIPMSSGAKDILERLKLLDEGNGFIVHDERGEPLCYEAMRWQIGKACAESGVPYYGQHAFRHTFATNCYNRGCDVKKLSKLLGHANVNITYNVYIHLFGDDLEDLRSVLS